MSNLIESMINENAQFSKEKDTKKSGNKVIKESKKRVKVKESIEDEYEMLLDNLPKEVRWRIEGFWDRKEFIGYCRALHDAGIISAADVDLLDEMNEKKGSYLSESKSKKKQVKEAIGKGEVYVIVEGGMVQDVFADTPVAVTVIDLDTDDPQEQEKAFNQYDEVTEKLANNELKYVW